MKVLFCFKIIMFFYLKAMFITCELGIIPIFLPDTNKVIIIMFLLCFGVRTVQAL